MNNIKRKIPLISVLALVVSSQVGTGALAMPTVFAPLGWLGVYTWFVAIGGALILAYIFSRLCFKFTQTGGPHVYILNAFGDIKIGSVPIGRYLTFFAGWLYWCISWISTTVVLISCMVYLNAALQLQGNVSYTLLGLMIWIALNYINLRGLEEATRVELFLTVIKVGFFLFFIAVSFVYFEASNVVSIPFDTYKLQSGLSAAMWCFIGLEIATTPAESVDNPKRNIPIAVMLGTLISGLIYIFSTTGLVGMMSQLNPIYQCSPYSGVADKLFGDAGRIILSISAALLCLGSLNAWIIAAGQIGLGLKQDKLLPEIFGKLRNGVPYFPILTSALGIAVIWLIGNALSVCDQIAFFIDGMVPGFIIIYLICVFAYIKVFKDLMSRVIGFIGAIFCLFLLYNISLLAVFLNLLIIAAGVPMFFLIRKNLQVK